MSTTFGWLHFTDLHRGMSSQKGWWSDWEHKLFEDLRARHVHAGPWDLVLFTGDLTDRGTEAQFAEVDGFLAKLWNLFEVLQPGRPVGFLAVPGNHDLQRPDPQDDEVAAELTLLDEWRDRPKVRERFWRNPSSRNRKIIERAFADYRSWAGAAMSKHPGLRVHAGLLPGDFAATFEKEGAKVGILGLNSAFLQLGGGDYEGRLAVDYRQFNGACGRSGPDWAREHHLCLLLTHHPKEWLCPDARVDLGRIVGDNVALHLHGHMHETAYRALSVGGGATQRTWQGVSLFGEEEWEGPSGRKVDRRFGYAIGRVELEGKVGTLWMWPRKAIPPLEDGGWGFVPDHDRCRLDDENRNATHPESLTLHREVEAANESDGPEAPAATPTRSPEAASDRRAEDAANARSLPPLHGGGAPSESATDSGLTEPPGNVPAPRGSENHVAVPPRKAPATRSGAILSFALLVLVALVASLYRKRPAGSAPKSAVIIVGSGTAATFLKCQAGIKTDLAHDPVEIIVPAGTKTAYHVARESRHHGLGEDDGTLFLGLAAGAILKDDKPFVCPASDVDAGAKDAGLRDASVEAGADPGPVELCEDMAPAEPGVWLVVPIDVNYPLGFVAKTSPRECHYLYGALQESTTHKTCTLPGYDAIKECFDAKAVDYIFEALAKDRKPMPPPPFALPTRSSGTWARFKEELHWTGEKSEKYQNIRNTVSVIPNNTRDGVGCFFELGLDSINLKIDECKPTVDSKQYGICKEDTANGGSCEPATLGLYAYFRRPKKERCGDGSQATCCRAPASICSVLTSLYENHPDQTGTKSYQEWAHHGCYYSRNALPAGMSGTYPIKLDDVKVCSSGE